MNVLPITPSASTHAEIPLPPQRRRWVILALKVAVSATLMTWVLLRTDLGSVIGALGRSEPALVAAAFALNFVGYLVSILRWRVLLIAQGARPGLRFLVQGYMTAVFFNNILPSTIGGDTLRIYDSWQLIGSRSRAVAVIVLDRLVGVLALALYAVVALTLAPRFPSDLGPVRLWLGAGVIGILAVVWVVFFAPRRLPGRAGTALDAYRGNRTALAHALGLSVLLQGNVILFYFLLAQSLDFSVSAVAYFIAIPIALVLMAVPISINGIGIRENAFAFLFGAYGVSAAEAVALAWLALAIGLAHGALGGIVYTTRRRAAETHATRGTIPGVTSHRVSPPK